MDSLILNSFYFVGDGGGEDSGQGTGGKTLGKGEAKRRGQRLPFSVLAPLSCVHQLHSSMQEWEVIE